MIDFEAWSEATVYCYINLLRLLYSKPSWLTNAIISDIDFAVANV